MRPIKITFIFLFLIMIIILITINMPLSCSFHDHITYSNTNTLHPYLLRVSVYSNGSIDSSLQYELNGSSGLFEAFNIEEIGFKIYDNGKLYIYLTPSGIGEEDIGNIIEELNKTLLHIYNFAIVGEKFSGWLLGKGHFSTSVEKIINFINNLDNEAAKLLSLSRPSYITIFFYFQQVTYRPRVYFWNSDVMMIYIVLH